MDSLVNILEGECRSGQFNVEEFITSNKHCIQVFNSVNDISSEISQADLTNFFITKVFPIMYAEDTDNLIRDNLICTTYKFLENDKIELTVLPYNVQTDFVNSIKDVYSELLNVLFRNKYPNWHKLWILFYKLGKEKMHYYPVVNNSLLKILIPAFRKLSFETILKAFDCWIAFIENAGIRNGYITDPTKLDLILRPFESQLKLTPISLLKRFEVFNCLMRNLKHNVELCLEKFLRTCFIDFDYDETNIFQETDLIEKYSMNMSVILCDLFGHSHTKEDCVDLSILKLQEPIVTNYNFHEYHEILILSAIKCTEILHIFYFQGKKDCAVTLCIWTSIFQLIDTSNDQIQKNCYFHLKHFLLRMFVVTN